MLIDLVPSFLEATAASDPIEGYHRYFEDHRPILTALWHNYILDLDSPAVDEVVHRVARARRDDLRGLLERVDVRQIAEESLARCEESFQADCSVDLYLLVGVGGPRSGELVIGGRGKAFVCMEHFTAHPNPETFGLGLAPQLLPVSIAHAVAHAVRYTSPTSRSEMARLVREAGGTYDPWDAGSRATVAELLINEGLAVAASRDVAPGFELRTYLGYGSRQYRRMRELETFLRRVAGREMQRSGMGLRLRYLAEGFGAAARRVGDKSIPERAGYYLGYRMAEPYVAENGIAAALRASADECLAADRRTAGAQSV
ncbi:MAG: hypothetical protein IID05_09960 [Gemmatimonadetes bacterium]|nr:hypothetical protein [Gemmatimonadota bacterium]